MFGSSALQVLLHTLCQLQGAKPIPTDTGRAAVAEPTNEEATGHAVHLTGATLRRRRRRIAHGRKCESNQKNDDTVCSGVIENSRWTSVVYQYFNMGRSPWRSSPPSH